ncbi:hypothetical protein HDA32_000065 [Spinactinospora alkalitolerans]|uniref:Uncharacterized protein n=1 Tax=Spinactinospora alkalitolerans TaxID=687207 RepID=A0A852TMY1_9ACTN|nr:hypothetical protein [Spinactinospora alkalitolerans]NYE44945.1 hypothetical protein [Spinactinospora alkalitolerans]
MSPEDGGQERVTAAVPGELAEAGAELIDHEDGRIAWERLNEIRAGLVRTVPVAEVARDLGL